MLPIPDSFVVKDNHQSEYCMNVALENEHVRATAVGRFTITKQLRFPG